ncbi:DNA repair protein RecO [Lacinutrix sp. C3R15]|uniref:DNA repair protein RecO n=1 Tax=Flavobacteriaceae TaxID=49546 RepID=UPI001C08793D|nr:MULTISPECIES: DNA repair protein RecO [Flavobacteriaceae]MBU2940934.1 DNA repair protein RecO [Lacinutrix sp. C3R15]MDO6624253.1 DNA repair protein RecO [Oceanihabitans sp. 1_MG-2023]
MIVKTNAIVLSKIKYGEHDLIIKCYTKEYGVVSFLQKGILKAKKGKVKKAYFQLLSQLELEITYQENRSLQYIKEVKPHVIYATLHNDIFKSTIVMFLSEVLSTSLQEEEENEALYVYLETTLQWLDMQDSCTNFHLLFLLKLTKHLGFYPEENKSDFSSFNLKGGRFENKPTDFYSITGENLTLLKQLLGTVFDNLSAIKINATQRQAFLTMLLYYFDLHLGSFKKPKSLEIFNQVFNT